MSRKHPIIAVTGSSGAGTSNVRRAFESIFRSVGIKPALVNGDGFHRYDRATMDRLARQAKRQNKDLTHFGPDGNHFDKLERLFKEYAAHGTGKKRYYIHNEKEAKLYNSPPGTLTAWEQIEQDTDLLLYEGLHGGLISDTVNIAQYVDLLIGVVPIINLEWLQKIHRDRSARGYTDEDAIQITLSRMYDYVHYIIPQFTRTDINFQRIPTVDISNPFEMDHIPTDAESLSVIHIRNQYKIQVNFDSLLAKLDGSFMSTTNTIVVPTKRKALAMQLILSPVIKKLLDSP